MAEGLELMACAGLFFRSLLAWAQGHVQQATITQLWQAGLGYLLWTHWAQWQTALLRVQGDQGTQAQGADLRHWPRLASRGRRLLLTDAPALWMQVRGAQVWGSGLKSPNQGSQPQHIPVHDAARLGHSGPEALRDPSPPQLLHVLWTLGSRQHWVHQQTLLSIFQVLAQGRVLDARFKAVQETVKFVTHHIV